MSIPSTARRSSSTFSIVGRDVGVLLLLLGSIMSVPLFVSLLYGETYSNDTRRGIKKMLPRSSSRTPTSRPTIENVDEDRRAVEGMDIQRKSGRMKRLGVRAVHRCGLFRIAASPRRHKCQSTASRQSHLSDEGLSVLPYRCKNSVPPRSHAPILPRFFAPTSPGRRHILSQRTETTDFVTKIARMP